MYELEDLASYNPEDIDNPEIEVCYEHDAETGTDYFKAVCLVDLGTRALDRLRELEAEARELKELKANIEKEQIYQVSTKLCLACDGLGIINYHASAATCAVCNGKGRIKKDK